MADRARRDDDPGEAHTFRSDDALVLLDGDLQILWCNRAAEKLTGVPAAAAAGRPCWEVMGALVEEPPLCRPDCTVPALAQDERQAPAREVVLAVEGRRRRVLFATIAAGGPERPLFVHLLRPVREDAERPFRSAPAVLTPRQREVIELLGDGVRPREISRRLDLSETTVRNHIRAILGRLESHSQLEAVAKARRRGIIGG